MKIAFFVNTPAQVYLFTTIAKIKILDFTGRDLENHEIDMVLLWAANISGRRDLATSSLDTFTLDYHVDTLGSTSASPGGNPMPRAGLEHKRKR